MRRRRMPPTRTSCPSILLVIVLMKWLLLLSSVQAFSVLSPNRYLHRSLNELYLQSFDGMSFGPSYSASLQPTRRASFMTTCRASSTSSETDTSAATTSANNNNDDVEETPLSDVDARVLQSMLQESKLDLETEEDVRKLLERGTVKTARKPKIENEDENSQYSSKVIKTITDTKLWKKFSTQASDVLESVGIWVANKVENDVKVLAALGLFAWDRAVRDVARALPEVSTRARKVFLLSNTTARQVFLLSNSSSYQEPPPALPVSTRSVMEEMNRPADEIKAVTRTILDILQGERRGPLGSTSSRALRTVAPAGTVGSGERVRRAYQQRRKLDDQKRDVTRIPRDVVSTAYEFRRELSAETNRPGYKTEGIRNAIGAGVSETQNLLSSIKESARLTAAKKKELRLKQALEASATSAIDPAQVTKDFIVERSRIARRLRHCIEKPEDTWLRQNVTAMAEDGVDFNQEDLREIVMSMILLRNQLEDQQEDESDPFLSIEDQVEDLRSVRGELESLRARTAESVSYVVANALWEDLIGLEASETDDKDSTQPLLLRIDDILQQLALEYDSSQFSNVSDFEDAVLVDGDTGAPFEDAWFVKINEPSTPANPKLVTNTEFVDVTPDIVVEPSSDGAVYSTEVAADASFDSGVFAELVSDDDFDAAVGTPRVATVVSEEEELRQEEESNILVAASLRVLDVLFFFVEKTFTVVVPNTIMMGQIVTQRYIDLSEGGKGQKGWQLVRSAADPRGRY